MAFVIADRVKETSTSTSTTPFALAGAMTGFKTFASRCAVGDTLYYAIQGVDGTGTPTAEWECGLGTYSSANTLTRTTVTASSNADAAVNFSAGTKQVYITMPAVQVAWARERLTAARTYYVRTDGSDSNTGLANTAGGAFLTIQKAVDVVSGSLDTGIYSVTIQVADGTYTGAVTMKALIGAGNVTIQGNSGTPANVVISTTSAHCFTQSTAAFGAYVLKDLMMQTTTSGWAIVISGAGSFISLNNVVFGACVSGHMYADRSAAITVTGNYTIAGGAPVHFQLASNATVACNSKTITITGTPAFSTSYMYASNGPIASLNGTTYSGSATGSRYNVSMNAAVDTAGATLPGNAAGTTATGGQYA